MGLKSQNFPLLAELWFDFGYPTCAWSVLDFLAWVDPNANSGIWTWKNLWKRYEDGGLKCESKEYGNSHDNDLPF